MNCHIFETDTKIKQLENSVCAPSVTPQTSTRYSISSHVRRNLFTGVDHGLWNSLSKGLWHCSLVYLVITYLHMQKSHGVRYGDIGVQELGPAFSTQDFCTWDSIFFWQWSELQQQLKYCNQCCERNFIIFLAIFKLFHVSICNCFWNKLIANCTPANPAGIA
jgi:hypothetical protein